MKRIRIQNISMPVSHTREELYRNCLKKAQISQEDVSDPEAAEAVPSEGETGNEAEVEDETVLSEEVAEETDAEEELSEEESEGKVEAEEISEADTEEAGAEEAVTEADAEEEISEEEVTEEVASEEAGAEEEAPEPEESRRITVHTTLGETVFSGEIVELTAELEGFEDEDEVFVIWEVNRGEGWEELAVGESCNYIVSAKTMTWEFRARVQIQE